MSMYCEKYKCTMEEKACIVRQEKALRTWRPGAASPDPGCKDCEQGKDIMKDNPGLLLKPDYPGLENSEHSIDMPGGTTDASETEALGTDTQQESKIEEKDEIKDEHQTSNIEHRTSSEKIITHTCRVPDCGHVGPLGDFAKNKASKDGHTSECKKCNNKRTTAAAKKRKEKTGTADLKEQTSTDELLKKITHTCECGHTGPLDDFTKNKASKDGHTNECKKCHSKRNVRDRKIREEKREAEIREKILKEQAEGGGSKIEEKQLWALKPEDKILAIDFGDHPELFAKIIEAAKEEIRTPEAQVLYSLKTAIKRKDL